jgi:predicted peptidase
MKKINLVLLFFTISFSLFTIPGAMAQQEAKYVKVEVKKGQFLESNFLLYLPEGYVKKDTKEWSLLLFLHGAGECGDFIELVKKNGPPMLIEQGKQFPFIVVSPQCPEEPRWSVEVLDMLLDYLVEEYNIDENCIFVTGLSMGGRGTWELAMAYPKRFAAIVPICGWADVTQADKIKDLPVWVFHGAKDDIVPPFESENMVNALKALGSPVKFTLYPEANHDSWTDTYNNPEMWQWLMEQCE